MVQACNELNGVETEIFMCDYADKLMIVLTQFKKLGTMVSWCNVSSVQSCSLHLRLGFDNMECKSVIHVCVWLHVNHAPFLATLLLSFCKCMMLRLISWLYECRMDI